VIDFGGLEEIPAEEFISATLWHLYKSLSSPYKSLLKLLLMESYASEYPRPQWLCLEVKKAIYQGNISVGMSLEARLLFQCTTNFQIKTLTYKINAVDILVAT
jgi:adenylate cyclase class 1